MSERGETAADALALAARRLAGLTIAELAREVQTPLPADPARAKGAIGHLVERALGASGGSRAVPDFPSGVELKTLPIDARGRPAESTFVTMVSAHDLDVPWERSHARSKLACVLFVPVESRAVRPFPDRRLGLAFLWSPSRDEDALLASDWASLGEHLLAHGEVRAHRGVALQIRPKGRNAEDTTRRSDLDGVPTRALKRGFYLRTSFTDAILARCGLGRPRRDEAPPR